MSASANDLVRNAAPNFATTLGGSITNASTTMTLSSVAGLPTGTGVTLVIDGANSAKEVINGVVSGSTIANMVRGLDGTSAQAHSTGASVVMWITSNLWNDFQTAFLKDHEQLNGNHQSLHDVNGNNWIDQSAIVNAVNRIQIANAATGNGPSLNAVGSDTNIDYNINTKGTGVFKLNGAQVGAWAAWTPSYSNLTVGNGTVTARYAQIGKTVHFRYILQLGSTSVIGTNPAISLPVAANSNYVGGAVSEGINIGVAKCLHSGVSNTPGITYITTALNTFQVQVAQLGATYPTTAAISAAVPFAWTTGDSLASVGSYEAA